MSKSGYHRLSADQLRRKVWTSKTGTLHIDWEPPGTSEFWQHRTILCKL